MSDEFTDKELDMLEDKWNARCIHLLESLQPNNNLTYDDIIKAKDVVREMADESRNVSIFKSAGDKYLAYKSKIENQEHNKKKRVELAVFILFERIASSPFKIMADGAVRLLTPLIDDFIKDAEAELK